MSDFQDKVVLITGAGRGMGRALALAFAGCGATVAANDISPVNLDETLAAIQAAGGRTGEYIFDVAKRMPVEALVNQVLGDWGRVDILVNHAAVEPQASILEMDEWDFHRTLEVNLGGPFWAMQQCGRAMRQQGGGVIINMANLSGRHPGLPLPPAYRASLAGLLALTHAVAREFAVYQVRVNAICSGHLAPGLPALLPSQALAGAPGDLAGLALFLCSQAAAGLTGQLIHLDGGIE